MLPFGKIFGCTAQKGPKKKKNLWPIPTGRAEKVCFLSLIFYNSRRIKEIL
jgi:hypothetical protein